MEINTIHNIDCRDAEIPLDSLIISDPPYNIGHRYLGYNDNMKKDEYLDIFKTFKGRQCVFIHYPEETIKYIVPAMGAPSKTVSWVYNSNTKRQHRMISWYNCVPNFSNVKQPYKNPTDKRIMKLIDEGSGGADLYDWWEINLVKNVSEEKTEYTNQIPEEIISRIIQLTLTTETLIVDPFCGSGTTCAVAQKLGLDWLGMDISREAITISKHRMDKLLMIN